MRDLFRAANLSPGAVYRYFSSKEELVAAVAAASPSIVEAALAATAEVEDPQERLRRLLEAAADRAATGSAAVRAGDRGPAALLRVAAALADRRQTARRALAKALAWSGRPAQTPS